MNHLDRNGFEKLLTLACQRLTEEVQAGKTYKESKEFENRVRQVIGELIKEYQLQVDYSPHPYGFPDIVLGSFGAEVKFTTNDTWRSVANSVFETFRNKDVKDIYVVFGKMGGKPQVRWGRYENCVMHVRTSHVPRFEVDLDAKESLFTKFGISYEEFSALPEQGRMEHIRKYARGRLKKGDQLWWLESPSSDEGHSAPLTIRMFKNLSDEERLKLRAETSLLFPGIVGSSHDRTKYIGPFVWALTYRGVYITRDAFSAGSVAGRKGEKDGGNYRGGDYVRKALQNIQKQMIDAAQYLDDALFVEYWGRSVQPKDRIKEWLKMADKAAQAGPKPWTPSKVLFRDL